MKVAGRSINLFLVDGSASGMRMAEIGLSTIKSVVCPRASLAALGKRSESKRTGVYFLVGSDPAVPDRRKVYIGEGDKIITRINAHDKDEKKEFWTDAILFISKDEHTLGISKLDLSPSLKVLIVIMSIMKTNLQRMENCRRRLS